MSGSGSGTAAAASANSSTVAKSGSDRIVKSKSSLFPDPPHDPLCPLSSSAQPGAPSADQTLPPVSCLCRGRGLKGVFVQIFLVCVCVCRRQGLICCIFRPLICILLKAAVSCTDLIFITLGKCCGGEEYATASATHLVSEVDFEKRKKVARMGEEEADEISVFMIRKLSAPV